MGILSYAQNREDVRLARVLKEPSGFYIDIGASDPTLHSMTRHFSDRGWRGVNVEPRAAAAVALAGARPRDVTIQAVIGRANGEARFFEMARPELGELSSMVPARREAFAKMGHDITERGVPMVTLARLCEEHAPAVIDFLSIDTEGAEADVIAGGDWNRFRPRVVVVESYDMTLEAASHHAWEPALLAARYVFAADDGINRFYVAAEEAGALVEPLSRPMSFLDAYEPYEYRREIERVTAESRAVAPRGGSVAADVLAEATTAQAQAMWAGYDALREEVVRLRQRVETYERQLAGRQGISPGGTLGVLAGHEGIGPVWLALAARATRLSRRYPALSSKVKARLVGVHQRLRRRRRR